MSARKLYEELYYWNHIGIGGDIVTIRAHRPQYSYYVDFLLSLNVKKEEIPEKVEMLLMIEAQRPLLLQRSFWRSIWLRLKNGI